MPYNKNLRIIQSWSFHRKSHIYKIHGKHSPWLHEQNRRKTGIFGAQWCVFSKEKTCLGIKLKDHSMCTKRCGQMSYSWGKRQFRAKGTRDRPRRWAGGWSCGDRHGGSWSGAACDERSWRLCPGAPAAWWASRHGTPASVCQSLPSGTWTRSGGCHSGSQRTHRCWPDCRQSCGE